MRIFIVGFARSGTTLCQRLVSEAFGLPTLPETHFFERVDAFGPVNGQLPGDKALALLRDLKQRRYLQLNVAAHAAELANRESVPIGKLFLRIVADQLKLERGSQPPRWLEKTPGHGWHLQRIGSMFPQAKFLWMMRDPLLTFASRRELTEPGKGWGEPWKPVEVYCDEWTRMIAVAEDFVAKSPGKLLYVRLEDLAAEPDRELTRIGEFLGLERQTAPQTATPQELLVQPFETWKLQALQPADAGVAMRTGREKLSAYEEWRVTTLLKDRLEQFGYDATAFEPPFDDMHQTMLRSIDHLRSVIAEKERALQRYANRAKKQQVRASEDGKPEASEAESG